MGRIVHVNVGWVTLTGYASVDCEGLHLTSVFDGHSNQVFSDEMPFSVSSEIFSSAVNLKPRSSFRPPTPSLARPISTDGPPFVFYRSSSSDSSSTSSCDERMMGNFPSRSRSPLLPLHLSPVSIGSKHFAIMCFA